MVIPRQVFCNLPPFEKNFYFEHTVVQAMSEIDVMIYQRRRDVPKSVRVFAEANFPEHFLRVIERVDFVEPTPIQSQGWILKGRDFMVLQKLDLEKLWLSSFQHCSH